METFDYILAWSVYCVAAIPLCILFWKALKRRLWRELAYLCESFLLALVFTPWYVLADEEVLAPALIIFVMDSITIGSSDAIRALIPLVMAMLLGVVVTIILSIIYRIKRRRQAKKTKAASPITSTSN